MTTLNTAETNKDKLVKYMVGRQLTEIYPERSKDCIKEEVVFEASGVCGNGDQDISLQIHKGEVLGIGGLVGAGRTEFSEMVFGMVPKTAGNFISKEKRLIRNLRGMQSILELDWFRRIEKRKAPFWD